jgi:ribosome biogenesis GTP-binding protein YsxC/EngB
MSKMNFKELGKFGKQLQVLSYNRCYDAKNLLPKHGPEILFVGKSNVGKSSLINTLLNYNISKISRNPGCTRWLGHLQLPKISIIDLPGYGFADVSKGRKAFWQIMMDKYLATNRPDLAFILVDSRKGIQNADTQIANYFDCDIIYLYTKSDQNPLVKEHGIDAMIPEGAIAVSAKNGTGILELRELLCSLIDENL